MRRILLWPPQWAGTRAFGNLDLAGIVDVLGYLAEIAHVELSAAAGAFHVMVGLGRCDAVCVFVRLHWSRLSFRLPQRVPCDPH
jgi:hypothetical protein